MEGRWFVVFNCSSKYFERDCTRITSSISTQCLFWINFQSLFRMLTMNFWYNVPWFMNRVRQGFKTQFPVYLFSDVFGIRRLHQILCGASMFINLTCASLLVTMLVDTSRYKMFVDTIVHNPIPLYNLIQSLFVIVLHTLLSFT